MNNKEIADQFKLLGNLIILLGENEFRARSYQSAYQAIKKETEPLFDREVEDWTSIRGIGKNIAQKLLELKETGVIQFLEERKSQVPVGILEILRIKGLGARKIGKLWKELDVHSLEELQYACLENRLLLLKGFGEKSQADILEKVNYQLQSRNLKKFSDAESIYLEVLDALKALPEVDMQLFPLGQLRRKCNVLENLELGWMGSEEKLESVVDFLDQQEHLKLRRIGTYQLLFDQTFNIDIYPSSDDQLNFLLEHSVPSDLKQEWKGWSSEHSTEKEVFASLGYDEVYPELYDQSPVSIKRSTMTSLIREKDIKGLVHCHSTYSDGRYSLEAMAQEAQRLGYEYMVITDHSKSAFYANGLTKDRVFKQQEEIRSWNESSPHFKIFTGIESDILSNGNLDYSDEVLDSFDVIIASVHSNLNMDETKATDRILKAIFNPYTTMLGHPTGRLLLGRKAYPLDHARIIEACAENKVDIELNANPFRLDIDWRWIPYCMELGVNIFINPDAHDLAGILNTKYGIYSARKGGLTTECCPNTFSLKKFESYIREKKRMRLELINNI